MYPARRFRPGSTLVALVLAAVTGCKDAAAPDRQLQVDRPLKAAEANFAVSPSANECAASGKGWIFCDDFESDRLSKYFEYDNSGGKFVRTPGAGVGNSVGMRATYTKGQSAAGSLKLAFGRTPTSYMRPADAGTANYREIYWRFYVRRETGWVGNGPGKLTRATVFAKSDWSQAMAAHAWTDGSDSRYLDLDPATGTSTNGKLLTAGYNDVADMRWFGAKRSAQPEEDASRVGQWACYEFHLKLNDNGKSNGVFELSVDGTPSAQSTGLNLVGTYTGYGINTLMLEQYTDKGAPAANVRAFDNLVVSTQPIGCGSAASAPAPVASVAITPSAPRALVGQTVQLAAATSDASGNALSGRAVTWTSSNESVATVSSTGLVSIVSVGTADITATSEGVSGKTTVTGAPVPVASVSVSPTTSSGTVGKTVQFQASMLDSAGAVLTGRSVTWISSQPSVVTINASGLATFVSAGVSTISATSEGKSGVATVTSTAPVASGPVTNECANPSAGWIFCDDFETDRLSKYFEYNNAGGKFVRAAGSGVGGSTGMRATYTPGQSAAGHLFIAFGRTPSSYMRPVDAGTSTYREIYWRFYVQRAPGWVGNGPGKLTRATSFAKSDWSQAMIAHGWTDSGDPRYLMIDPASGTTTDGTVATVGYNDFAHLRWLGGARTAQPEEDASRVGQWACYEFHAKLNDAGQSNGEFDLSVNGQLSARKTGLNWVGSYNAYGINAILLEQFQNEGAPAANVRQWDNVVVSTQPIGCGGTSSGGSGGTGGSTAPASVASVTVSPSTSSAMVGQTLQLSASTKDATGSALSGRVITWISSNSAVATVNANGTVTIQGAGSATITATSEGVAGQASVSGTVVPVSTVTVSLSASSLAQGKTAQASATMTDAVGNILSGRTVSWSSSNTSVATVSASGVVTAMGAGSATITATSEGKTGSAGVSVTAPAAAQLAMAAQPSASATSGVAFAQQPSVQLLDANGIAVTQSGVVVTAAIASGGGSLGGTTTATTNASGVASFSNLSITGTAGGRTLRFTTGTLTAATSNTINVADAVQSQPSNGTPLLLEDFSTYSSTSNFLSNPRGIWNTVESKETQRLAIDESVGYGGSTKSMRYDFPNNGVVCWDYGMRPGFLKIPGNQTHVWVEFVVRFSPNFRVSHGATACASEYKLAAMGDMGGIGRWNLPEMQTSQFVAGYPGNDAGYTSSSVVPSTIWDGQPHVFRVEAQLGKAGGGIFKFWVDGKLLVNQSGFTTSSSHNVINWFAPGLNMNQGPSIAGMQMWWHKIAVFNTDPGWK